MPSKLILKKSSVTNRVPVLADLEYGELAINYADGKLYYKTSANTIDAFSAASGTAVHVANSPPTTPAAGDLWWNSETAVLSVYYQDANSSQWVSASTGAPGPGVAAGGTTGQVLSKASNTNYDTAWTSLTGTSSTNSIRNITTSTSDPTGGSDGDIWIKYTA
jgi:hypothetical protein